MVLVNNCSCKLLFFPVHRHFQLFQTLRALNQIFEQSKHIQLTWSNAHIHPQRFTLHVRLHVRCVSVRQRRPTVSTAASATGRPPADRERKGDTHQKFHPESCTVNAATAAAASQAGEVGRTRAGRIQMRTCETGYKCLEWITEQLPVRERDGDMGGWLAVFIFRSRSKMQNKLDRRRTTAHALFPPAPPPPPVRPTEWDSTADGTLKEFHLPRRPSEGNTNYFPFLGFQ